MIEQLLNRAFVLDQLEMVKTQLESAGPEERGASAATLDAVREATQAETVQSSGQSSFDVTESERRSGDDLLLDDVAFFSRDPVVSNLQSALEEYFETQQPDLLIETESSSSDRRGDDGPAVTDRSLAGSPRRDLGDDRRIFDKFSITDPGWVCSKLAEGITKLRGKHPFRAEPATPCTIADRTRLVVVGDWGSGLPRARTVATVMRGVLDESAAVGVEQHVIHLGDTYYSGWKREYEKRFLPMWPVRTDEAERIPSWAVNSNHDMYSGGHAYFDTLLTDPRFARQEGSSYFSLANKHWRVLGLDTAWETERLSGPQKAWLEGQVADARSAGQKIVLLSHHPLFSAYDAPSPELAYDTAAALADGGVDVWLWGHEHRLMTFAPHMGVKFARCIGHGGVPVYMWRGDNDALPAPANFEYRARFRRGVEYWAVMGFAVVELDGPTMKIRYVNEFGVSHRNEETS